MKCLSLWQPWASAMAQGLKINETRGSFALNWKIRGPLLIHAAKHWTKEEKALLGMWPFADMYQEFPLGVILCKVEVIEIVQPKELNILTYLEEAMGNYSEGRAIIRTNPKELITFRKPIPFKGSQGIFHVPDSLVKGELE